MWQGISRQFAGLVGRTFGPQAGKWTEENGLPVFGILGLILLGFCAFAAWASSREVGETDTPADRQRNRRYGRWTAAAFLLTGFALLGRSLTFGSFDSQKVQEVVWSLAAGTLGTTAWVLLLVWCGKTLTPGERWKMRAGLVVPVALGLVFAVVGVTRSPPPLPPPTAEEVAKAKAVVRELGGLAVETDPKTNCPTTVYFRKRTRYEETPGARLGRPAITPSMKAVELPLRDDDLPPLLDALRVLYKLKTVDLTDTALTPAGVERVRTTVPSATVTGPVK